MFNHDDMARESFAAYIAAVQPHYKFARHLDIIIQALEMVARGEIDHLMIFTPPRHSKSWTATQLFPSWYLGKYPERKVLIGCHTQTLATQFGGKILNYMQSKEHELIFPECRISSETTAKREFKTTKDGDFYAVGIGGGVTGRGGDLLIIDDPVKDAEAANSPVQREAIQNWYESTWQTRKQPNAAEILIQCMTGDTRVSMANGAWSYLRDLRIGDNVLAWKKGRLVKSRITNWSEQGIDDVYEINTGNSKVRANARHPFLIETDNGVEWKPVSDLTVGDRLITSCGTNALQRARISEDEAWLLGYMFGDGWITIRNTTQKGYKDHTYPRRGFVTCVALGTREERNARALEILDRMFGVKLKRTKYGYARTDVAKVGRWFINHGLKGNAHTKRLPLWLYGQPKLIRLAFLQGYNHADGSIVANGPNAGRWSHGSCNELLITDIRHLARGVGYKVSNIFVDQRWQQAPSSPKPTYSKNANVQWNAQRYTTEFTTSAIRKIKHVGQELVYDIEVHDAECFIADGLVSHNTRWHENDLSGWLLDPNFQDEIEDWHILKMPAIAEEDEGWRKEGEALWPEMWPLEKLLKIKRKRANQWVWPALYQQTPSAIEGMLIKRDWWKSYAWNPHMVAQRDMASLMTGPYRITQSWDTAFEEDEKNDFSVCSTWLTTKSGRYLLDVWRKRVLEPELIKAAVELAVYWKPSRILIEKKSSGHGLVAQIKKFTRLPVIGVIPKGSKYVRIQGVSGVIQSGGVFVPHAAPWLGDWMNECSAFPTAAHDDQVDTLSQFLEYDTELDYQTEKYEDLEQRMQQEYNQYNA